MSNANTAWISVITRIAGSAGFLLLIACTPASVYVETDRPQETAFVVEVTNTPGSPKLYYECEGEGSPTVLIESGLGESGTDPGSDGNWRPVMDGIKGTTRICTYDRVNLGKSDQISDVRTSQDIVDDLQAMLTSEGIEGPYILVGHSIGGFHVRLFTKQHPDQVVGMLLLDSTHPDNFALYSEHFPTPSPDEPVSWAKLRYSWTDADAWAANRENFDFAASADMVRETGPFGDLPLIVLAMDPARYDAPPEIVAALAKADDRIQRDLAALSTYTRGDYTIVPDAGHFIYINKPQVVIDALLELIAAARN